MGHAGEGQRQDPPAPLPAHAPGSPPRSWRGRCPRGRGAPPPASSCPPPCGCRRCPPCAASAPCMGHCHRCPGAQTRPQPSWQGHPTRRGSPCPQPSPEGHSGAPRSDPRQLRCLLGRLSLEVELEASSFHLGRERRDYRESPQSQPSQIPRGMGPPQPHLLLLPLDGLHGVPQVGQAGEGPWPEGVCKERGVTSRGALGAPWQGLGGVRGFRGAQGGSPLPGAAWLRLLASPSPPRSMLGVAGKRWVTGGLHSRRGDRGPLWGDSGSGQG